MQILRDTLQTEMFLISLSHLLTKNIIISRACFKTAFNSNTVAPCYKEVGYNKTLL